VIRRTLLIGCVSCVGAIALVIGAARRSAIANRR
jgi:hypothetical protein